MAATRALSSGNWQKAVEVVSGMEVWKLVAEVKREEVVRMLGEKIREEALRTYLLTYSSHYESLSLDLLIQMFDLPEGTVHSLVSCMMMGEEVRASWDQTTRSILMHAQDPTRLQHLAMQVWDLASEPKT